MKVYWGDRRSFHPIPDVGFHVLGALFGGAADRYNLVAFEGVQNGGRYLRFEQELADQLGRNGVTTFNATITYGACSGRSSTITAAHGLKGSVTVRQPPLPQRP
ncbi:DNA/RNA non-specific endonuclease [Asticcacaulis biprosthecium]|uniref:DNA/RNA non-specific endonuclease n=1 Tax=Asticcacaulis biprosthecium TaxID=76891 RepID=UPI0012F4AC0F